MFSEKGSIRISIGGSAIILTLGKFIQINPGTYFPVLFCTNRGRISNEQAIPIIPVIVSAAAVVQGKLQQLPDRINALFPQDNNEEK